MRGTATLYRRWGGAWLLLCAALLAACSGGPVRRVSPPSASIQQLTVNADGGWSVQLRLQNFSSIPMRFEHVSLQATVADEAAGTLEYAPQFSIGPESADVITIALQPSAEARMAVADALAGQRALAYTLKGRVDAVPQDAKQRSFDLDTRNRLNPVPGVPGALR